MIHSFADGHLGCFQYLAIVNCAAMNIGVHRFFWIGVSGFSHTVGSLLILMLFSLAMQKLFILMRSHLFILSFMSLALGDMSVRMFLCGMSEIFLPMLSSRTFMESVTTYI